MSRAMKLRYLEFLVPPAPGASAPIFWRETWPALLGCPGVRAVLRNRAVRRGSPLAPRCSAGTWTTVEPQDLHERELAALRALAQGHFAVLFQVPIGCLGRLVSLWPVSPTVGGDLEGELGLAPAEEGLLAALAMTTLVDAVLVGFADEGMLMALVAEERSVPSLLDEVSRPSKETKLL